MAKSSLASTFFVTTHSPQREHSVLVFCFSGFDAVPCVKGIAEAEGSDWAACVCVCVCDGVVNQP